MSQRLRVPVEDANAAIVPLDLRNLLVTLRRHVWLIVVVTTLSTGYAVYWTRTHAPLYSAQATVRLNDLRREMTGGLADGPMNALAGRQVRPRVVPDTGASESRNRRPSRGQSAGPAGADDGVSANLTPRTVLANQESLDSITLDFGANSFVVRTPSGSMPASYGQLVVLDGIRFRIEVRPNVKSGTMTVLSREAAIQRLLSSMKVRPRDNTNVADVIYMDVDPRLAQRAANQIVQVFQDKVDSEITSASFRYIHCWREAPSPAKPPVPNYRFWQ